jgi:hypothetical protein
MLLGQSGQCLDRGSLIHISDIAEISKDATVRPSWRPGLGIVRSGFEANRLS